MSRLFQSQNLGAESIHRRVMALVGSMPTKRPCSPPTITATVNEKQLRETTVKRKRMYASVNELREVPADGQLLLRSTLLERVLVLCVRLYSIITEFYRYRMYSRAVALNRHKKTIYSLCQIQAVRQKSASVDIQKRHRIHYQ